MNVDAHTVIRSRRRTLALQVNVDAQLVVRAPERISARQIEEFVLQNRAWIERQVFAARERRKNARHKTFADGDVFLYLGKEYPLVFDPEAGRRLTLEGGRFLLPPSASSDQAKTRFIAWYRKEALFVLSERAQLYSAQSGLSYRRLKISSARRRWGSCSSKGSLSFAWRLILAPLEAVDYVVAHELAHLAHPNHSTRFWAKVGSIFPDYRESRRWLRQNQNTLDF